MAKTNADVMDEKVLEATLAMLPDAMKKERAEVKLVLKNRGIEQPAELLPGDSIVRKFRVDVSRETAERILRHVEEIDEEAAGKLVFARERSVVFLKHLWTKYLNAAGGED